MHILAKPLPRREILLSKLAVSSVVSLVVTAPALFVAGLVLDGAALGLGCAVGGAAAAVAYCAIFAALSLTTRRPVLFGLVYVLMWEGLLSRAVSGTGVLSVQQYAVTIADRVGGTTLLPDRVSLPVALVMTGVVLVGATVLAVDRLRSFTVPGGAG